MICYLISPPLYSPPGMNRDTWKQLSSFITEKRGRVRMSDVLIANSLQHLSHKNGRLALVEAVTALESTVKRLMPKAAARLPGSPKVTAKQIDKLMNEAGLRLVTDIGLKLAAPHAGFQDSDINDAVKAIEERNRIIHNDQREVDGPAACAISPADHQHSWPQPFSLVSPDTCGCRPLS